MVTAKITVRELVPALVDDYISFFDGVYHDDPWLNTKDNPWWGICYCGFYDDPRTEQEQNQASNARTENRKQRGQYKSNLERLTVSWPTLMVESWAGLMQDHEQTT